MAYERLIKLYKPDNTAATDIYPGGVITDALRGCRFELAMRGGCMGGQLVLPGTIRDPLIIPRGYIVRYYFDDDATAGYSGAPSWATASLLYTGFVSANARRLADGSHVYELAGYWSLLDGVAITGDLRLGELNATATSPEGVIEYLIDTYIAPQTDITKGTMTASGVTVQDVDAGEQSDMLRVIEQMELIASSGGDYYTTYADQYGRMHFEPVDLDNVQATYTIGLDATSSSEERQNRNLANNAKVIGGAASDVYSDATSIATYGRARRQNLPAPELMTTDDMDTFAAGYFVKYGAPALAVKDLARVHPDDELPPLPWAGVATYQDTARGELLTEKIFRVGVSFDEVLEYTIELGDDRDSPTSRYAPSPMRDLMQHINPPVQGTTGEAAPPTETIYVIPIHRHIDHRSGGANPGFGSSM